jgi:hypothetical protein
VNDFAVIFGAAGFEVDGAFKDAARRTVGLGGIDG